MPGRLQRGGFSEVPDRLGGLNEVPDRLQRGGFREVPRKL